MNEPIVFKRSASVALWSMLRAIAPALVSAGSLFVIASFFGVRFENQFLMLAIVVAVLASIIVQLPTLPSFQLMPSEWPTIASLLLRWMALLGILLAIGYAAKVSDDFSRRVVVTWALVTPLLLIGATLLMNEFMRRYLFSPQNTRKAVFAGYNEASLALAERLQEHRELGAAVQGFFDDRSAERLGLMDGSEPARRTCRASGLHSGT